MYIPLIRVPGLVVEDDLAEPGYDQRTAMLNHLRFSLFDGAVALRLFSDARAQDDADQLSDEHWQTSAALNSQAVENVQTRDGSEQSVASARSWMSRVFTEQLRLAAESGHVPIEIKSRERIVHARSFVFALDGIEKGLGVLASRSNPPPEIARVRAMWREALPGVNAVRDSAHHMEDRWRGVQRNEKPIDTKPFITEGIHFGGNGLWLENIDGNRLSTLTASGEVQQLEIDQTTLATACEIVQKAHDAYTWDGPSSVRPMV